jgi:hypothetical protein
VLEATRAVSSARPWVDPSHTSRLTKHARAELSALSAAPPSHAASRRSGPATTRAVMGADEDATDEVEAPS